MTEQPPRRPRHLLDPANPRPAPRPGAMSIEGVQKWVLSVLAFTTIIHMSLGLVIAAVFIDDSNRVSQIGINVIAAAFGVIAVATAFAIHKRPMLSPWLALGLLPGIVGIWLCLR